jgi:hypothetical protein
MNPGDPVMTSLDLAPALSPARHRALSRRLGLAALLWAGLVTLAAGSGLLARLWMPAVAGLVALGIAGPTLWYFTAPPGRAWADRVGLRAITAFHIWRIPASFVFFAYGALGLLPPVFWIAAGTGDLIAGLWAWAVVRRRDAPLAAHRAMHRFGFADFCVAVGTGLVHTLLVDPRMAPVAELPLALIPLFGVGISGASHLVAFDMIRRRQGVQADLALGRSPAAGADRDRRGVTGDGCG